MEPCINTLTVQGSETICFFQCHYLQNRGKNKLCPWFPYQLPQGIEASSGKPVIPPKFNDRWFIYLIYQVKTWISEYILKPGSYLLDVCFEVAAVLFEKCQVSNWAHYFFLLRTEQSPNKFYLLGIPSTFTDLQHARKHVMVFIYLLVFATIWLSFSAKNSFLPPACSALIPGWKLTSLLISLPWPVCFAGSSAADPIVQKQKTEWEARTSLLSWTPVHESWLCQLPVVPSWSSHSSSSVSSLAEESCTINSITGPWYWLELPAATLKYISTAIIRTNKKCYMSFWVQGRLSVLHSAVTNNT